MQSQTLKLDPDLDFVGFALVEGMSCRVYRDRLTEERFSAPINAPLVPSHTFETIGQPAQLKPFPDGIDVFSSIETAATATMEQDGSNTLFQRIVLMPFLLLGLDPVNRE